MSLQTIKLIVIGVAIGLAVGLAGYTFIYAKGYSYMTNNPASCANCHIMQEQFDGWIKSSHRAVATCNDCHTPSSTVGKYMTKASNGFWHSFYFTTNTFHEPIQITPRNREITEQACRKCHQEIVEAIESGTHQQAKDFSCLRCHNSVGHLH
jgi:cytochrome c nitrite reductase small subunit